MSPAVTRIRASACRNGHTQAHAGLTWARFPSYMEPEMELVRIPEGGP